MRVQWKNLLETPTKEIGVQWINNENWRFLNDLLGNVDWDQLSGISKVYESNREVYEKNRNLWDSQIKELQDLNNNVYNQNWKNINAEFGDHSSQLKTLGSDVGLLKDQLANWDTTTEVGDVKGLDDIISNLQSDYQSNIQGVESQLGDYVKTSDFDTRMSDNLDALGKTLRGEFGDQIGALDIDSIRQAITNQGGDLSALTENFAGLNDQIDLQGNKFKHLLKMQGIDQDAQLNILEAKGEKNLADAKSEWKGDLTDLQNILESGRGEDLANLESQLGKDRTADLLNLQQQIESGTASDIQNMAGNIRQEFGDQVFDLSNTFDQKLSDTHTSLGGDISQLFDKSGSLQSGLDTLTSGLGTTTQQLEALEGSFGDYKTDAATNLANVESAFTKQLGDQGSDFTKQLGDLQSSTAQNLLGLQGDIEADRAKDLSDLDTSWSGKLQAQDQRLQDQFKQGSDAFNKRLSDISASMNYRTLGDSAEGVKIRRSKAYNTGRTRSGTGQLGRSMKISTLNI